jgi:hypothetical protein
MYMKVGVIVQRRIRGSINPDAGTQKLDSLVQDDEVIVFAIHFAVFAEDDNLTKRQPSAGLDLIIEFKDKSHMHSQDLTYGFLPSLCPRSYFDPI